MTVSLMFACGCGRHFVSHWDAMPAPSARRDCPSCGDPVTMKTHAVQLRAPVLPTQKAAPDRAPTPKKQRSLHVNADDRDVARHFGDRHG